MNPSVALIAGCAAPSLAWLRNDGLAGSIVVPAPIPFCAFAPNRG